MHCPRCGKENPEDANFCMHCGADLREYKVKVEISPKVEIKPKIHAEAKIDTIPKWTPKAKFMLELKGKELPVYEKIPEIPHKIRPECFVCPECKSFGSINWSEDEKFVQIKDNTAYECVLCHCVSCEAEFVLVLETAKVNRTPSRIIYIGGIGEVPLYENPIFVEEGEIWHDPPLRYEKDRLPICPECLSMKTKPLTTYIDKEEGECHDFILIEGFGDEGIEGRVYECMNCGRKFATISAEFEDIGFGSAWGIDTKKLEEIKTKAKPIQKAAPFDASIKEGEVLPVYPFELIIWKRSDIFPKFIAYCPNCGNFIKKESFIKHHFSCNKCGYNFYILGTLKENLYFVDEKDICSYCGERIAEYRCEICNKPICYFCSETVEAVIKKGILKREKVRRIVCKDCAKKIGESS